MAKERINSIDIIKGFLIVTIIAYHMVYRNLNSAFDIALQELIYLAIPVFFFFSGFFYKHDEKLIMPLLKRLKKFALPVAGIVAFLHLILSPYYVFTHGYDLKQCVTDFLVTFLRPELMARFLPQFSNSGQLFLNMSPVWFIWALIFATILHFVILHFVGENKVGLIIAACILFVIGAITYIKLPPLSWSLSNTPVYTGLMIIGFLFSKGDVINKMNNIKLVPAVLISVVLVVVHILIYKYIGLDQMYRSVYDQNYTILGTVAFIAQTFIGGFVMFTFARLIEYIKPAADAIAWCGRHTNVILIFHSLFGGITSDILHTYNKMGVNWYVDPLTTEILIKSWITFFVGLAGSILMALLNDKLREIYEGRKAKV